MGAAAIALLLCLLPTQVNGLITAEAKCLSGFDWMFSSIGQSPCDIQAELISVCSTEPLNVYPLCDGCIYNGPTHEQANSCWCNTVVYSLQCACSNCQGRQYIWWSDFYKDCSTPSVVTFPQPIPTGVKVPAYAYQNVSGLDYFDLTAARNTKGAESSGPPVGISTVSAKKKSKALIGGVVGGVVGFCLLSGLIVAWLVHRRRRKRQTSSSTVALQQSPVMAGAGTVNTPTPHSPAVKAAPLPPGSPGSVINTRELQHRSSALELQLPPVNQGAFSNYIGNGVQSPFVSQTMLQDSHRWSNYTGMPEL